MKDLIILTGPTAVGKTELSIALAKAIGGEIISADSMQIYKGMNIGTAKIKEEEKQGVPHWMMDLYEPDFPFNVTIFKENVLSYMKEIKKRGKIPILVGGTGFYIQSVLYDVSFCETNGEDKIRASLQKELEEYGKDWLHHKLKTMDEVYAKEVSPNNTKKVIRAISYFLATGTKLSEHNKKEREKTSPYRFSYFVLTMDRKKLYERIDQRVEEMVKEGLFEEVGALYKKGYTEDMVSMRGIGYKEVFAYFRGEKSREEVKEEIKLNTRHFAKRQLTWFRREKKVCYINKDDYSTTEECLNYILNEIKNE